MPDPLTAAELAALASITDASDAINMHLAALKALAATAMSAVPSIPPAPIERAPLNPVPIRASLIGEPMQNAPIAKPTSALELARYQVPGGGEIKPDHGS